MVTYLQVIIITKGGIILNAKFEKQYEINMYDVDSKLQCKFSSIVNYLWDVVISQSDALGETDQGLVHNNCTWVLLKYDINIHEYPKYKEKITVDTEVSGVKKFYGYRKYTIKNSQGKIIANAVSMAILIDINRRRPTKVSPDQYEIYGLKGDLETPPPLDDLLNLESIDFSKDYYIRYSDIDSNNHVNNVKYMELSIDTLPRSIVKEYSLSNIKVLFKKEAIDGDVLHVSSQVIHSENDVITTVHTIIGNDEKLLTKLQFKWKKLQSIN